MSHTVNDLRAALFRQLDALQDGKKDIAVEISRAKAMSDISRTILESAKVELEHQRLTGSTGSGFLDSAPLAIDSPETSAAAQIKQTATGTAETVGNRTVHKLR